MLERAREASRDVLTAVDEARRRRTGGIVLELDLTEPLVDAAPHDPVAAVLARRRTSLRAVLDGLQRAARDPRVRALVVKVGGARSPLGLGRAQELRDALDGLRRRGRWCVAWAETFGELDRGSAAYLVAAGCDEIWLQPSGDLCLAGAAAQVPFLRDALDKAGVVPQITQRHEYKSAANLFTERSFTPAHREATEGLVASLTAQIVAGVAAGRGIDEATVRAVLDRAPLAAAEARDAGLVDRLGYRDEVYAAVRDRAGADASLLYVDGYARAAARSRSRHRTRRHIALVHIHGTIHLGRSGRRPLGGATAGAASVCAALRAAAADRNVAAVVLRVDSRGGSYVASDAIWREVAVTRAAGTPVVVSMGDVAASGGYFVAAGADAIVAEPATVTGSIGVVAGKAVVAGLAGRLGIGHEEVAGAARDLMFSPLRPFSDDEWARLDTWLDRIY
ncbi:MAG TPA: S49 family peptidase, partial [Acidimicrobiales bacterium]